jgi:hypothetical protein
MENLIGPRCELSGVATIQSKGRDVPPKLVDERPKRLSTGSGILRQDDHHPPILPRPNAHAGVDFILLVLVILGLLGWLSSPQGLSFRFGQRIPIAEADGGLMFLMNRSR